jgi:hypothetical protein
VSQAHRGTRPLAGSRRVARRSSRRQDLLPQTCRAAAAAAGDSGAGDAFPPWFLPAFDLATEAHRFIAAHDAAAAAAAAAEGGRATWIVKRATGTHSTDACVTRSAACVLRHALAPVGGDRVVQRYAPRPALLRGRRKFDVRVYVAVRAFAPALRAAVDERYYGRLAAAPFSMDDDSLSRFDTHFTVSWYKRPASDADARGGEAAAPAEEEEEPLPTLLSHTQLEAAAAERGWDWHAADSAMRAALAQLFAAAGRMAIPPFPAGRGLYGCDVLFEEAEEEEEEDAQAAPSAGEAPAAPPKLRKLHPRLLEVNFCGDLATLLTRVPGGAPGFVGDVMAYLFASDGALPPGGALQALV